MRILLPLLLLLYGCQPSTTTQRSTQKGSDINVSWSDSLQQQARWVQDGKEDSAILIGRKIYDQAKAIGDSLSQARAILAIAGDYDASDREAFSGDLPALINFLDRKGMRSEANLARIFLGRHLSSKGDYAGSQQLMIPAWKVAEAQGLDEQLPRIGLTIADNLSGTFEPERARAYLSESLRLAKIQQDSFLLPSILLNIGIWHALTNADSSAYFFDAALLYVPHEKGSYIRMKILYNKALLLFKQGKLSEAEEYFIRMAEACESAGLKEGLAVAYKGLGFLYNKSGSFDRSIRHLNRSIRIAEDIPQPFLVLQGIMELQETYEHMGNYAMALATMKRAQSIRDSMFTAEKELAIVDLEQQYKTEKKELENKGLRNSLILERKLIAAILGLFVVSLLAVVMLLQRQRFLKERNRSQAALIERYQKEKASRQPSAGRQEPEIVIPAVPDEPEVERTLLEVETIENERVLSNIQQCMELQKPYLNPKLRLEDLAEIMSLSPRRLSGYLRWSDPPGFNALINAYRVREARRLLESADTSHLKLEAIGQMAGFSSRQYFYKVFEQNTGLTQGFYRKKMG